MRDFVVLADCSEEIRKAYSHAYGNKDHPSDFALERLRRARFSFGRIKEQFVARWPDWIDTPRVHEAMERAVIYRNAFGHAQVQPFRPYLLYTPTESALKKISNFTRCAACRCFFKDCQCKRDDVAEPRTLVFRCLDPGFLESFFGDIRSLDLECFLPTAKRLGIPYQGIAWPQKTGYLIGKTSPQASAAGVR